jgi:hypothetical protein
MEGAAVRKSLAYASGWCVVAALLCTAVIADEPKSSVLLVVGASGTDEFGEQFRTWSERWKSAAQRGKAEFAAIGLGEEGETPDREQLALKLAEAAKVPDQPLWLVLIGHGTFDGKTARFNLRGPDVSSAELAAMIKPIERPLAIVNCTSASGPFLAELSAPNRIVIAATRSGHEVNFSRLGDYLSAAIADPAADLDKDDQTSLLEAYLLASGKLAEFYKQEARLATEHALLDDTGDKLGTPPDWFRGVRAVKTAKDGAAPDGVRAAQWVLVRSGKEELLSGDARTRRDALERDLAALRDRKIDLPEDEYLALIEPILVELAKLYGEEKK